MFTDNTSNEYVRVSVHITFNIKKILALHISTNTIWLLFFITTLPNERYLILLPPGQEGVTEFKCYGAYEPTHWKCRLEHSIKYCKNCPKYEFAIKRFKCDKCTREPWRPAGCEPGGVSRPIYRISRRRHRYPEGATT